MSVIVERDVLKEFQRSTWRSPVQLATTVTGLAAGWILTDRAMAVSWALGVLSSLVIAVFTMRDGRVAEMREVAAANMGDA